MPLGRFTEQEASEVCGALREGLPT